MKETQIIYSFICIISILILIWSLSLNNLVEKFDMNDNDFEYPNLYYINLEKRKDRKKHIEEQLKKIDYPKNKINRIDAISMENRKTACTLSHIKAIEEGLNQDDEYIIVLEDDFEWKYDKEKTLNILNNAINTENWNIIILSCNGTSEKYSKYLNKVIDCQTRSGYIIKKMYIPILLKVWREAANIRIKYNVNKNNSYKNYNNKNTAGDIVWKKLQNDNWFSTNPILGKQMKSYSDIEEKVVDYKV
tara:strand:+ start:642 stop:1382 length:741 start_codon:yes stop_codon:yes gene_type:complete